MSTKLLLILLFSYLLQYCTANNMNNNASIKGMFVFGSSLVDNGNNNFLQNSLAKADYLPYGVDFPSGPSGRFTNGKNVIDLLGEKLNLPSLIPTFSDPSTKGTKILHGVNYASAASGILDDTGSLAGHVISLNEQIKKFEEVTLPELKAQLGHSSSSRDSLPNYLFVVGSGGNDYSFNYFLKYPNSNLTTLQSFTLNLTNLLSQHLKKLYSLGGRKFVLISLNPIGCSPMVKGVRSTRDGCLQGLNRAAHLFNTHLKNMVDDIKTHMPGSTLVFVNSYKIIRDIIKNPASTGFKDTSNACCKVESQSEGGNGILCKRGGEVCAERSHHVFFDGLHPTEAVNVHIANKAFHSYYKNEVYPINVNQLAKL
ncbi:hypothetical protein Q3G72_006694 [Acer saccharum]|nr:hypothetical protein Q3G72_006694 [Acer saccharum]